MSVFLDAGVGVCASVSERHSVCGRLYQYVSVSVSQCVTVKTVECVSKYVGGLVSVSIWVNL